MVLNMSIPGATTSGNGNLGSSKNIDLFWTIIIILCIVAVFVMCRKPLRRAFIRPGSKLDKKLQSKPKIDPNEVRIYNYRKYISHMSKDKINFMESTSSSSLSTVSSSSDKSEDSITIKISKDFHGNKMPEINTLSKTLNNTTDNKESTNQTQSIESFKTPPEKKIKLTKEPITTITKQQFPKLSDSDVQFSKTVNNIKLHPIVADAPPLQPTLPSKDVKIPKATTTTATIPLCKTIEKSVKNKSVESVVPVPLLASKSFQSEFSFRSARSIESFKTPPDQPKKESSNSKKGSSPNEANQPTMSKFLETANFFHGTKTPPTASGKPQQKLEVVPSMRSVRSIPSSEDCFKSLTSIKTMFKSTKSQ